MLPGERNHFAKCGAAGLLGGFDVDKLLRDLDGTPGGIGSEQINLGGDAEAFAFLVLGGNAGIDDGGTGHGYGLRIPHGFPRGIGPPDYWINRGNPRN